MKTITVASTKGGSGKSTIVAALAVRAAQETPKIAMMDLNFDQGSLTQWWQLRGKPQTPFLAQNVENIPGDIRVIAAMKYEWLFIDSPATAYGLDRTGGGCRGCRDYPCPPGLLRRDRGADRDLDVPQAPQALRVRPLRGGWPLQGAHQANARGAFRSWAGAQNANQLPAPMDTRRWSSARPGRNSTRTCGRKSVPFGAKLKA